MIRRLFPAVFSVGGRRRAFANGKQIPNPRANEMEPLDKLRSTKAMSDQNRDIKLNKSSKPQIDSSVDEDEFAELGPSVNSHPKSNFDFLLEKPKIKMLSFRTYQEHEDENRNQGERKNGNNFKTQSIVIDKNVESKEKALKAGRITMGDYVKLLNDAKSTPKFVKIRISKISTEFSELAVHRICNSFGSVIGLARTEDQNEIDVLFSVNDGSAAQNIINRLNNFSVEGSYWSAQLLQNELNASETCSQFGEAGETRVTCNSSYEAGETCSQIGELIGTFRKKVELQRIYLQDLEHIHHAILHLREQPSHNNNNSSN